MAHPLQFPSNIWILKRHFFQCEKKTWIVLTSNGLRDQVAYLKIGPVALRWGHTRLADSFGGEMDWYNSINSELKCFLCGGFCWVFIACMTYHGTWASGVVMWYHVYGGFLVISFPVLIGDWIIDLTNCARTVGCLGHAHSCLNLTLLQHSIFFWKSHMFNLQHF